MQDKPIGLGLKLFPIDVIAEFMLLFTGVFVPFL
jgi:hypothetical protein